MAPHFRPVHQCIFCTNRADSREHAWSDWAIRRVLTPSHRLYGHVEEVPFDPNQKAVKVRCVCEGCNGGWMKALEDSVVPTVGRMLNRDTVALDVLQQHDIARWAVLKAMVWEYTTRERDIFYSSDEHLALRLGHIPANTAVWLAGHEGREALFSRGNDASNLPGGDDLRAWITTMALGPFVVQTMTVRASQPVEAYSSMECRQLELAHALVRAWPTVGKTFWPPLGILNEGQLELFHRRCAATSAGA